MSHSENQLDGAARANSPLKKKNDSTPDATGCQNELTPINYLSMLSSSSS